MIFFLTYTTYATLMEIPILNPPVKEITVVCDKNMRLHFLDMFKEFVDECSLKNILIHFCY